MASSAEGSVLRGGGASLTLAAGATLTARGARIAGSRSHALEIVINQTIEVAAMVLCGASTDVMLYKGAISIVSGMWIHANVDLRLGWLSSILDGPELHRWHHAIEKRRVAPHAVMRDDQQRAGDRIEDALELVVVEPTDRAGQDVGRAVAHRRRSGRRAS